MLVACLLLHPPLCCEKARRIPTQLHHISTRNGVAIHGRLPGPRGQRDRMASHGHHGLQRHDPIRDEAPPVQETHGR